MNPADLWRCVLFESFNTVSEPPPVTIIWSNRFWYCNFVLCNYPSFFSTKQIKLFFPINLPSSHPHIHPSITRPDVKQHNPISFSSRRNHIISELVGYHPNRLKKNIMQHWWTLTLQWLPIKHDGRFGKPSMKNKG